MDLASSLNLDQLRRAVAELSSGVPVRAPVPVPQMRAAPRRKTWPLLVVVLLAFGAVLLYARLSTPASVASFEVLRASEQARKPETPFKVAEFQSAEAPLPVPPQPLGEQATRKDLVQFAKDHAAYYAAQGVPEHEAMLYIGNKVREVVASQRQREAPEAPRAAPVALPQPAARPLPLPLPQPQPLPLVMKLTGDVPIVTSEDLEPSGRRKKVSSESKEVEEYMRRRQNALGIESAAEEPSINRAQSADPHETFL